MYKKQMLTLVSSGDLCSSDLRIRVVRYSLQPVGAGLSLTYAGKKVYDDFSHIRSFQDRFRRSDRFDCEHFPCGSFGD